jgi:hypothetical protein
MKNIDNCQDAADAVIAVLAFIFCITLVAGLIVGWVLNIVRLVPMEGATGMLVLRAVGILFAPLGAVLGYVG